MRHERRRFPPAVALLLAAPLVALAAWIVTGGLGRSFGPKEPAGVAAPGAAAGAAADARATSSPPATPYAPGSASAAGSTNAAPDAAPAPAATAPDRAAGLPRPEGLAGPETDLPPDRFWERVDGAADALIAAGCRRMVVWKATAPAAEIELLVFEAAAGAAAVLARDVGDARTPGGPGDEASVAADSVYFRRGRHYVRILADPSAPANAAALLDLARNMDSAIRSSAGGGPS